MSGNSIEVKSRRLLLKGGTLLIGIAIIPSLLSANNALATTKLARTDVKYQDKPEAGKDCDDCIHFIPGSKPKVTGICRVVEGPINPHGYCVAFTPKQNHG